MHGQQDTQIKRLPGSEFMDYVVNIAS